MHYTPLKLPNMVCQMLFEGQGWSPDQLPLSLILASASKLLRSKNHDALFHH